MNNDYNMPDGCRVNDIPGQDALPCFRVCWTNIVTLTSGYTYCMPLDGRDGAVSRFRELLHEQDLDPNDFSIVEIEEI
jgi:hypothetical protein